MVIVSLGFDLDDLFVWALDHPSRAGECAVDAYNPTDWTRRGLYRIGQTDMREWPFKILIDGECPLCRRESRILAWLDRGRNRLLIENIGAADFDPTNYGVSMQELMGQIHGVLPDGTLLKGMEVFRRAYDAVGLGWLLVPTRWPILRSVSDAGYAWFARNRLRVTGRAGACGSGRCHVP